jgi:hypothetical protein
VKQAIRELMQFGEHPILIDRGLIEGGGECRDDLIWRCPHQGKIRGIRRRLKQGWEYLAERCTGDRKPRPRAIIHEILLQGFQAEIGNKVQFQLRVLNCRAWSSL